MLAGWLSRGGIAFALAVALAAVVGCRGRPPYEGRSVAELERMLRSDDPGVQLQGAHGLSLLGPEARDAVPALAEALKGSDSRVRQSAARALGAIGAEARDAVPALAGVLEDADWTVQRQAALALGEIGPPARSAAAALGKLGRSGAPLVRQAARGALQKVRR
jgi:HEAT repeat protein